MAMVSGDTRPTEVFEVDERTEAREGVHELCRRGEVETAAAAVYESVRQTPLCEALSCLLDGVLDALDAAVGSVLLVEADSRMRIAAARGIAEDVVRNTCLEVGMGISGHVALHGQALLIRDIERDDRFRRHNQERYYTPSCISAPLIHDHAVRGVLNVANRHDRKRFDRRDLALLEAVGARGSRVLAGVDPSQWRAPANLRTRVGSR